MPIKSPRIVGQGDCPRVAGQKPPMPSSGQSSKKTKMDKSISLPHIRIQLKESNKIQKSIRDVLVPRGHFKVNIEGESRSRYPRTGPKIYSDRDILVSGPENPNGHIIRTSDPNWSDIKKQLSWSVDS